MNYKIRIAKKDDTSLIVELINCVTLNIHSKNINQWTYPWDINEIEEDYMISVFKY